MKERKKKEEKKMSESWPEELVFLFQGVGSIKKMLKRKITIVLPFHFMVYIIYCRVITANNSYTKYLKDKYCILLKLDLE